MVSFGITSIPAQFNTLNYCIGPVENCDLFIQSWDGVKSTWYAFMNDWKCCGMAEADCRVCALISQFRVQPDVAKSLISKELIHKAKSDNTDLFRNFAASIGAIPLQCDVHGSGVSFQLILYFICILLFFLPQRFHITPARMSSISQRAGRRMKSTTVI